MISVGTQVLRGSAGGGSAPTRAAINALFRADLTLSSGAGWTLGQPSSGSTSWLTGPDRLQVSIPDGATGTGGGATLADAIDAHDPYATWLVRLGTSAAANNAEEAYVVHMGADLDTSILIGFVRGDGAATLAYYVGGTYSAIATGTAPTGWVAALASGQALLGLSRAPTGVALVAGIAADIADAGSVVTLASGGGVIAVNAARGTLVRAGLDVYSGSRSGGTTMRVHQARVALQGAGGL